MLEPKIGHVAELHLTVAEAQTIALGRSRGLPEVVVFSTPSMINLMEHAARKALEPFLESGEESVGVTVEVRHLAASRLGAAVHAVARVTQVEGTQIDFVVEAYEGSKAIGSGTHRRAVVQLDRLRQKMGPQEASAKVSGVGPMPQSPLLESARDGALLRVWLNRPERLNARNAALSQAFADLRAWLVGQRDIQVVILGARGPHFCAGDDVKEFASLDAAAARRLDALRAENCVALARAPQVWIASIRGHCLGGGLMQALGCDFRIASHDAHFGLPEVKLGWPPAYGLAQAILAVGGARAIDLCLTGRTVAAREAQELGLVHRTCPGNQLDGAVQELAAALLQLPPQALAATKARIWKVAQSLGENSHLGDLEAYNQCQGQAEAQEGIRAFLEKRSPRWPEA